MFDTTQCESDQDIDDVYSKTAAAITVRKCKVFQRKKKLRLFIDSVRKLNNELILSKNETTKIVREKEDITHQETFKIENINGVKVSQASLETQLCDLKNKIALEKNENQEKKDKYNEALQNSEKIWESYEKQYNELPLAKKKQEISKEIKNVTLEIKSLILNIKEHKEKKILKDQTAEKRRHNWVVKLANAYFEFQECTATRNALMKKKRELKKEIEDIKAGKLAEVNQYKPQNTKTSCPVRAQEIRNTNEVLQFKLSTFQVMSPPSISSAPPKESYSSSWLDLLKSPNWFPFLNNTQNKPVESVKSTRKSTLTTKVVENPQPQIYPIRKKATEICKTNQNEDHLRDLTTKSSNNWNNSLSPVQNKVNDCMLDLKRKCIETTESITKTQTNNSLQTKKRSLSHILQATQDLNPATMNITDINKVAAEKSVMDTSEKKESNEGILTVDNNQQNRRVNDSNSDNLSAINSFMSSYTENSKKTTIMRLKNKHLMSENFVQNILSSKQPEAKMQTPESQNTSEQSLPSSNQLPMNNLKLPANYQRNENVEDDMFGNENQLDNASQMTMDPNSPPDVIPENRSQSLSQTNTTQIAPEKHLSQSSSEFTSPQELDEASKLHYQQIAAESPGFVHSRGPEHPSSSKPKEAQKQTVKSHYFSNLMSPNPTQSSNSPTTMQDIRSPIFSPPSNYNLNDDSNQMNVLSPPPGNLGAFGLEKRDFAEVQSFAIPSNKDNKANNDFFNFMSSDNKKPSSSSFFFSF